MLLAFTSHLLPMVLRLPAKHRLQLGAINQPVAVCQDATYILDLRQMFGEQLCCGNIDAHVVGRHIEYLTT